MKRILLTAMSLTIAIFVAAQMTMCVEMKDGSVTAIPVDSINQVTFKDTTMNNITLTAEGLAPTVRLNSGHQMPILGLGTWSLSDKQAEECTYEAIKIGYRLFDTANYYGTEAGVGRGVRRAIAEGIVKREDIFVTTKLTPWNDDDYDALIDKCNETIGLGYIDLLLIHQRARYEKQLYRAIERAVERGVVRSMGISNYYTPKEFDEITEGATLMPTVIQNENHIYYQNAELQAYVSKKSGTFIESWYPFGGRGNTGRNLGDATIKAIAEAHGKTPAQITLRWQLQAGYIAIPGSSNVSHIRENFDIFDFALTDEEMTRIARLNRNERYETW